MIKKNIVSTYYSLCKPGIIYGNALTEQASQEALDNEIPQEVVDAASKTVVGIEAMAFDISDYTVPFAGLISADPMEPKDVDRILALYE